MPMTRFAHMNPWNLFFILILALGVCLFDPFQTSKAFALEPNSPLFEQNKNTTSDKEKALLPLALPEEKPNPSPGILSTLVRIALALALIVALIVITVWGLKIIWEKWGWTNQGEEGKPIKVLTSAFLAPRKTVHLVEIGKRILVVGVGSDEVTCLDVITDPEEVEVLRQASQQGFPKIFTKALQKNEMIQEEEEAKKIVQEGKRVVGGYVEGLKKFSKKRKQSAQSGDE